MSVDVFVTRKSITDNSELGARERGVGAERIFLPTGAGLGASTRTIDAPNPTSVRPNAQSGWVASTSISMSTSRATWTLPLWLSSIVKSL